MGCVQSHAAVFVLRPRTAARVKMPRSLPPWPIRGRGLRQDRPRRVRCDQRSFWFNRWGDARIDVRIRVVNRFVKIVREQTATFHQKISEDNDGKIERPPNISGGAAWTRPSRSHRQSTPRPRVDTGCSASPLFFGLSIPLIQSLEKPNQG